MAKKKKDVPADKRPDRDEDDGIDLSTAAEMWSEDELRQLIREEAVKILMGQQAQTQQGVSSGGQFYPNTWLSNPKVTWTAGSNNLYDGHSNPVNYNSSELVGASS